MGKKKKGAVCNNPVAMARASGTAPVTGPTIRDYLARDRPSLEEATALLERTSRRKESGALAAYEEQMNDQYKEELQRQRERLLGGATRELSTTRDKKKKKGLSARSRSRSRSPSSHPRKSKKKRGKHRSRHFSSSDTDSGSESDDRGRSRAEESEYSTTRQ